MEFSVDLQEGASGEWSARAHDLPERTLPSSLLPCATADIVTGDVAATPADAVRLTFAGAMLTPYANAVLSSETQTLYLFVYQPNDRAETLAFERRIEPRYQDYYAELDVSYAGVFDVTGLNGQFLGEILAFERPLEAAIEFVETFEPAPDIALVEDECRGLQNRDAPRHLIWLTR